MATHQHPALLLVSLLFASSLVALAMEHPTPHSHAAEKEDEVVVQGVVNCQSCAKAGTQSLLGAKPLPSAKVVVSCKDNKNRVCFYKPFATDGKGYFYAPLRGLDAKCGPVCQPRRACTVRLLSSADPRCNLPTNLNYGISGSPLRQGNKTVEGRNYGAVVYSAGPVAFRPAYCPLSRPPHHS